MKVTPLDIRRKEFKRSVRGYSDEEVDVFLDAVADEFERLFQENVGLQDRVRRLEEQLAGNEQLRGALEKTLVSAQLQADQTKANAQKESELIMRDAELKARGIVSDSYSELQRVQQTLIQLKRLEEDFRFKFRSLLQGHLRLLEDAPITVEPGQAAPAGQAVPAVVEEPTFTVPPALEEVPEYPAVAASAVQAESPVAPETAATILAEAVAEQQDASPVQPVAMAEAIPAGEAVAAEAFIGGPETSESLDGWSTDETLVETGDTETVEQASIFSEFDKAGAQRPYAGGDSAPAASAGDDPLSGFFFSGSPATADDVALDGDDGGRGKPRDFEW